MALKALFRRNFAIVALVLASVVSADAADSFPTRAIRIVVTSTPGGALDVTTRLVAQRISETLGQPVIVDNRAGAGGLIAIREVKAATADGYTLLAAVNTVAVQQAVNLDPGYDLVKDFVGVGLMTRSPFLLVESAQQPDKSLADLLARAKTDPDNLPYASAGTGSTTHLAAAMFAKLAGLNLRHIPYKGNSAAWPDLIAGRVGILFEPYSTAAPMIRGGQFRALGATSTRRLDVLPDVPTIAEQGVPNYSFYLWIALLAPAATPKDVVNKLSDAVRGAVTSAELQTRFRDEGSEAMLMSADETTSFLRTEAAAVAKLVSDLDLQKQ